MLFGVWVKSGGEQAREHHLSRGRLYRAGPKAGGP